jgi:hypothetical protein
MPVRVTINEYCVVWKKTIVLTVQPFLNGRLLKEASVCSVISYQYDTVLPIVYKLYLNQFFTIFEQCYLQRR